MGRLCFLDSQTGRPVAAVCAIKSLGSIRKEDGILRVSGDGAGNTDAGNAVLRCCHHLRMVIKPLPLRPGRHLPFTAPILGGSIVFGFQDSYSVAIESSGISGIPEGLIIVVLRLVFCDVIRRQPTVVNPTVRFLRRSLAPGETVTGIRGQFGTDIAGGPEMAVAHVDPTHGFRNNHLNIARCRCGTIRRRCGNRNRSFPIGTDHSCGTH